MDSCVECWAISEGNTKGKNKKKKRKNKGMCSDQVRNVGQIAIAEMSFEDFPPDLTCSFSPMSWACLSGSA